MLTDRQNKFYIRIKILSTNESEASATERKKLCYCVKEIEAGVEPFKNSINRLNYELLEKIQNKKKKQLSDAVINLTKDLVEVYGPPVKKVHGLWDSDFPINTSFYS